MTDNSNLISNNVGLTSDLNYNLKPRSAAGRSYRCSVQPTNKQSFVGNDTIIMYIPCGRRNTFLDPKQSYIKYTVKNTDAANPINFDGCGASVINRLDVFHASNLLESVQQYNVLYNYLMDFQLNVAQKIALSSVYGFNFNSGQPDDDVRKGAPIAAGKYLTCCMPLLSGVVGLGLDKMLPVGVLNDDIRLEFTLETNASGMVSGTAECVWNVLNVELVLTYVELSDEGMSLVNENGSIYDTVALHGNSWRHYVSSLPAATSGTFSTLVPQRFASTKSLVCLPRRATEITDALSYSVSSRINPNIASYWWRLGSALIPTKYVTLANAGGLVASYAEGFMEIQKAFHSLGNTDMTGSLAFDFYNVADVAENAVTGNGGVVGKSTAANSFKNGFAIAQELETYANRSDTLLSGTNTLSQQTFFECNIGATAPATNYTLDFYSNYDQIIIKDNQGILSVRF